MPWYLYLALKQLFPTGKRLSFTTFITVVGVLLGVMVLIIVQSVMNGFGEEIRKKIVDFHGDIRVASREGFISNTRDVLAVVEAQPNVATAMPYAEGIVLIQYNNRPAFPLIRGLELESQDFGIPLRNFMVVGDLDALDDESLLLSSGLARTLGATVGATVELYSPLMLEKLKHDEILLPRELSVAGIFETGWNQIDANAVISTLRLMQEVYNLGTEAHAVLIRTAPGADIDTTAAALHQKLPQSLSASTWRDSNRDLLWILKLEKSVMFFIIIFIVLVASFSITIALTMSVMRKTREIGLLIALGATPRQAALGFCLQGFIIGLVGSVLGVLGALIALAFRNDIIHAFARFTHSEAALLRFYQFADIPVHYTIGDFIVIITFTVVTATLAGLVPAWKAVRLKPAEALRHE